MNPYGNANPNSRSHDVAASGSAPDESRLPCAPVIRTGRSSVTVLSHNAPHQSLVPSPYSDRSTSPLPASSSLSSQAPVSPRTHTPPPVSVPTPNPYLSPAAPPPPRQVSVIIPSPDLRPSPLPAQCSEEASPDLECSICFSEFNNVFRCPKMLHCKHTFCLECLARINVKSVEPSAIQCPLCRSLTPLPTLGLPRLTTDSDVLSYLPAAMQRVYSIRFLRNKGKLEVKRSSEGHRRWGRRSLISMRSVNRSLDVGLPSPPIGGRGEAGGVAGALFRLTGRPACRAFLLGSVVMMMVLLTAIIIFLLIFKGDLS